jgi:DNA invertase Pin-like site-specific DNA recombinase
MRRARLEGKHIGRRPLAIDRAALLRDRARGLSYSQLAQAHAISRTSVRRILSRSEDGGPKGSLPPLTQPAENRRPATAA